MADLNKLAAQIKARLQKGKPTCKQVQKDHAALDRAIKAASRTAAGREEATTVRRQLFSAGRRLACKAMEINVHPKYKGGRPQWGNHGVRSQRAMVSPLDGIGGKRRKAERKSRRGLGDLEDGFATAEQFAKEGACTSAFNTLVDTAVEIPLGTRTNTLRTRAKKAKHAVLKACRAVPV